MEDFHGSERRNGGSFFELSKEGALGEHVEVSPHSYLRLAKLRHGLMVRLYNVAQRLLELGFACWRQMVSLSLPRKHAALVPESLN